jgi:hypothetical protein
LLLISRELGLKATYSHLNKTKQCQLRNIKRKGVNKNEFEDTTLTLKLRGTV